MKSLVLVAIALVLTACGGQGAQNTTSADQGPMSAFYTASNPQIVDACGIQYLLGMPSVVEISGGLTQTIANGTYPIASTCTIAIQNGTIAATHPVVPFSCGSGWCYTTIQVKACQDGTWELLGHEEPDGSLQDYLIDIQNNQLVRIQSSCS